MTARDEEKNLDVLSGRDAPSDEHSRFVGFNEAKAAIAAGNAKAHALWVLISNEHDREGYALKPSPWEGSGEYQRVHYSDGRDVLVRIPHGISGRSLPTNDLTRTRVRVVDEKPVDSTDSLLTALRALVAKHDRPHGFHDEQWYAPELAAARAALSNLKEE